MRYDLRGTSLNLYLGRLGPKDQNQNEASRLLQNQMSESCFG